MPKAKKSDAAKSEKSKTSKSAKEKKPAVKKSKKSEPAPVVVEAPKPAKLPKKPAAAPKAKKPVAPKIEISIDDIALRAYFIAERRQAMGWPGDSTSDWVEAESQLKAEALKKG